MFNKFFFFILHFVLQITVIYSSSEDPVVYPETWTPETLYDYVTKTFLNPMNPRLSINMNHMIVDPERYLQYADLQDANNYMDILYEKYNISSHIFFISHMENKFQLDEEIAAFVSKLSYLLYKNYAIYDEKMTLTAVFFLKDRKMRIRTSKNLRDILSDYDCLNILNRRKNDLKNNNYQQVVNGLMKDILYTYKSNFENKDNNNIDSNVIIFTIIFIVIVVIVSSALLNKAKDQPSRQEDKVKVFLDKLKNRSNPKEIFSESCIICLGDFLSKEKIKELEKNDKNQYEKEETIVLECGHKFHRKCIEDWLKKQESCPFCRMKFDIKGNNNDSNKQNIGSGININFENILSEILRIQSNRNLLNRREINRIRNVYYPGNSPSYTRNYSPSNSYSSTSSSHNKSYKSFNKGSGGATSGW